MYDTGSRSEDLLAQLTWTRRLADRLVADAGLAEDVVQEAWVQYLTRPPRAAASVKAWFARVMRNLARQHWRRDGRRAELEGERVAEGAGEATAELVARAHAQKALVQAVLELEQSYRDVVLLCYFEELESPAIAKRLGMPASSVRTRLKRGLELLRAKLEARHGSSARDWLAGILPLFPRPAGIAPAAVPAGTAASLPVGWMAVTAAVVALIASVVLVARSSRDRVEPPQALAPVANVERSASRPVAPGTDARRTVQAAGER